MTKISLTPGIKEKIQRNLIELNGFHEVTSRVYEDITDPEWKEILEGYFPDLDMKGKTIYVDMDNDLIRLD